MTEARPVHDQLTTLDLLCSRALDAEHGGPGTGASGPGYRIAELAREEAAAVLAALRAPLAHRWGEPEAHTLADRDRSEIPEPWAFLGTLADEALVWRLVSHSDDRRLALALTHDTPTRLLALVTTADLP
ncbi:hypothetical protein ACIBI4_06550 [Streptomyces sp. NPDC050418]|uniref:hypothetical protein n=1 Tax=Streptomyces sp. NPDC050418 TaxID=3365612 RepID=UPI0037B8ABB1